MANASGPVYDLHITIDPIGIKGLSVCAPWKILDIHNVQGAPHCIVSKKYIGDNPHSELDLMAGMLGLAGASVQRKKIEFHFQNPTDFMQVPKHGLSRGIVEVHYKFGRTGAFPVSEEQIAELNRKKLALSFNMATERVIVSARFNCLATFLEMKASDELPPFLKEEEREVVVSDTDNSLDSFWPLRLMGDGELKFTDFPEWIPR